MKIIDRIKHAIRNYYVLYADSTDLLDKARKSLRPLPEGCNIVRLTLENKNLYQSKWDVDRILDFEREVWTVVNNENEIIAWCDGTYKGTTSLFFKVRNCDFEHMEIIVDERYRRKGLGVCLLYHEVKNLKFDDVNNKTIGVVIRPDNNPSLRLHELIGFKISHRVRFFHMARKKDGHYRYYNFPHYTI